MEVGLEKHYPMKVLHLCHSDRGGAGRAAFRLHRGLRRSGIDSKILVQTKLSDDTHVISHSTKLVESLAGARVSLDSLPLKFHSKPQDGNFSLQWLPENLEMRIKKNAPDIINLHWINQGYLRFETLKKLNTPLVWTLHDMWPFTGGCHYSYDCKKYEASCSKCPILDDNSFFDLSNWIWKRKHSVLEKIDLTIVSPSNWLAQCAKSSSLFEKLRIEVIHNGLDLNAFKPVDQLEARKLIGLPVDKKIILFGALKATSSKRKGFHIIMEAMKYLRSSDVLSNAELAIFGSSKPEETTDFGFKTNYLGTLNDDISLRLAYSAADIMLVPSLQENLANTVVESFACQTPCIAFNIGGMPDIIDHEVNGYLAPSVDSQDLAMGIQWLLMDNERLQRLGFNAREKALKSFDFEKQASRYSSLFSELTSAHVH